MAKIDLAPINKGVIAFSIEGTSPLITHNWDEKAKEMMRQKQAGKKTKTRDIRDREREAEAATYRTADGRCGFPAMALKSAIISAAHKDIGIEKTLIRKAMFLRVDDPFNVIPIIGNAPTIREDMVRVGVGQADLRYRPMWDNWSAEIEFEVDMDLLTVKDVITLVDRAGFGIGICEWRPEKGGEFGRFRVDQTKPVEVK